MEGRATLRYWSQPEKVVLRDQGGHVFELGSCQREANSHIVTTEIVRLTTLAAKYAPATPSMPSSSLMVKGQLAEWMLRR